jgi:hypothetical protein
LQQPVDQSGLAMIDMGDDRHVAELHVLSENDRGPRGGR